MQPCFPTHSRSKAKCPKDNHMRSLHRFYIFNELPCSWSSIGIPPAAQVLFHVPSWIQRAARLFPHLQVHFNFIRSQRTWRSYFFLKGLSSDSNLATVNIWLQSCSQSEPALTFLELASHSEDWWHVKNPSNGTPSNGENCSEED